ncbi:MAG: hypothetical protein K6D59_07365 [Bacteroidales bacterium]|nr:hypothetical protein [Bacteroidales bacterium]
MAQIGQFDMDMAKYILCILKTQPNVVCSWGFHSPYVVKNGLRFHVNGFQHRGLCEVVYDEGRDTFTFRTFGKKGVTNYEMEDVYFDNLIEVIDSAVETGKLNEEQYKEKVTEWLEKGVA